MGSDKIRHFVRKRDNFYWQPSKTLIALGMIPEALGTDEPHARAKAVELNNLADQIRRAPQRKLSPADMPGTVARLIRDFKRSDEFTEDLKPRTQDEYTYYGSKIELELGHVMVRALSPKVIKTYYRRLCREVSITWGYHILSTLRALLSWGVSEDWIDDNPALKVKMRSPPKRTVTWKPEQTEIYVSTAPKVELDCLVPMAFVFDSIGQSPVDVRTLKRSAYDGHRINVSRAKTGNGGAPIPLFPRAKEALDAYLATQPDKHPDAPLFTNPKTGKEWTESQLQKAHRALRKAAGLPSHLQLQDFRTTAATEAGAAGATAPEIRGLLRHTTVSASEHYVHPDAQFTESTQNKRLAHRNKAASKVGTVRT